jgi:hypothetical protein
MMLKTAEYDNHEDGLIWVFGSNSNFDFFVRKQALNRAQGAPGGRGPPCAARLSGVVRDLVSQKSAIVWMSLRAIGPVKGPAAVAAAAGMGG